MNINILVVKHGFSNHTQYHRMSSTCRCQYIFIQAYLLSLYNQSSQKSYTKKFNFKTKLKCSKRLALSMEIVTLSMHL